MAKLSKAKKERIELYLDMLQFNCDVIKLYTNDTKLELTKMVEDINSKGVYDKKGKALLNILETIYHKWVLKKKLN